MNSISRRLSFRSLFIYKYSNIVYMYVRMSRKENPQKLTQLSSRSHPRHLVGKRTAQKDIIIDTTSDSQVNSNFPNRWKVRMPSFVFSNVYFFIHVCIVFNFLNKYCLNQFSFYSPTPVFNMACH